MHSQFDAFVAEKAAQAYREASERDLEERPCKYDNCIELWDRSTGKYTGSGWGPVGCPCQDEET